jgi:hypothetical protein
LSSVFPIDNISQLIFFTNFARLGSYYIQTTDLCPHTLIK